MQKIDRAFFALFFSIRCPHYLNLRSGSIFVLAVAVRENVWEHLISGYTIMEPGTGYANFGRFEKFEKSPEEKAMIGYWFDVVLVTLNTSQWVDACKNQNESCSVEVAAGDLK